MRKPVIALISLNDSLISSQVHSIDVPSFPIDDKYIKSTKKRQRAHQSKLGRWLAEKLTQSMPGQAAVTSISHRGQWVACLLAAQIEPVGLDLEIMQERDAPALLEMLLTEPERALLIENEQNSLLFNFYRCWTLKEALGKQTRLGWSAPKDALDLSITQQCCGNLWLPELKLMLAYALAPSSEAPEPYRMQPDGSMQVLEHVHLPWHE